MHIRDLSHYLKDHNLPQKLHTYLLQTLFQSHHIQGHHPDSSTSNVTNRSILRGRPKLAAGTLTHAGGCPRQVLPQLTHSLGLGGHTGHLCGGLSHGADVGEQAPGWHSSPQDGSSCSICCCRDGAGLIELIGSEGMEGEMGEVTVTGESLGASHRVNPNISSSGAHHRDPCTKPLHASPDHIHLWLHTLCCFYRPTDPN